MNWFKTKCVTEVEVKNKIGEEETTFPIGDYYINLAEVSVTCIFSSMTMERKWVAVVVLSNEEVFTYPGKAKEFFADLQKYLSSVSG